MPKERMDGRRSNGEDSTTETLGQQPEKEGAQIRRIGGTGQVGTEGRSLQAVNEVAFQYRLQMVAITRTRAG